MVEVALSVLVLFDDDLVASLATAFALAIALGFFIGVEVRALLERVLKESRRERTFPLRPDRKALAVGELK